MWAALFPDGELSQFERRILEVHLARCADCMRHAEQVAAIVAVVRDTPSESPETPVQVVRRVRFRMGRLGRMAAGGSAAAATAAALVFSLTSVTQRHLPRNEIYPPVLVVDASQGGQDDVDLLLQARNAKRAALTRQAGSTREFGAVLSDQR